MASLRPPAKLFDNGLEGEKNVRRMKETDSDMRNGSNEWDSNFISENPNISDQIDNIQPGAPDYMKRDFYTEPVGDTKELRAKVRLENENSFDNPISS